MVDTANAFENRLLMGGSNKGAERLVSGGFAQPIQIFVSVYYVPGNIYGPSKTKTLVHMLLLIELSADKSLRIIISGLWSDLSCELVGEKQQMV